MSKFFIDVGKSTRINLSDDFPSLIQLFSRHHDLNAAHCLGIHPFGGCQMAVAEYCRNAFGFEPATHYIGVDDIDKIIYHHPVIRDLLAQSSHPNNRIF